MKKEALSAFTNPDMILIGFLLFFFCFLGVLLWTVIVADKNYFSKVKMIPLTDNDKGAKK